MLAQTTQAHVKKFLLAEPVWPKDIVTNSAGAPRDWGEGNQLMKDRKPPSRRRPSMNKNQILPMNNDATLGRDVQQKIGEQLRAYYDDVVNEGVPDRFAELLKRLDERGGGDKS